MKMRQPEAEQVVIAGAYTDGYEVQLADAADTSPEMPKNVIELPSASHQLVTSEMSRHRKWPTLRPRQSEALSTADEQRLVSLAQQGDMGALETLWLDARRCAKIVALKRPSREPIEDRMQTCLTVVPRVVERYDETSDALYHTLLYGSMVNALKESTRYFYHQNGLHKGDYRRIRDALKPADDPTLTSTERERQIRANLHALTQWPKGEKKDYHQDPRFVEAPTLVLDGQITSDPASLSLHKPHIRKDEPHETLEAGLVDDTAVPVEEQVINLSRNEQVTRLVGLMRARDRFVIRHFFGLDNWAKMSLTDIGEYFGVSESMACHMKRKALKNLASMCVGL